MRVSIYAALIAVIVASIYCAPTEVAVETPRQPYSFAYGVKDDDSSNDFIHAQTANEKVTVGSYRVALPDGRIQIVSYKVDKNGYVADVQYEGYAQYPPY